MATFLSVVFVFLFFAEQILFLPENLGSIRNLGVSASSHRYILPISCLISVSTQKFVLMRGGR